MCFFLGTTHRLDSLLQPVYLLLQEVERAGLAAVAGEGGGAGGVDRVHPVLQLNLTGSLRKEREGKKMIGSERSGEFTGCLNIYSGMDDH